MDATQAATTSTRPDAAAPIPGYYDSPFPAEDGGPRRQMVGRGSTLNIRRGGTVRSRSRQVAFANMTVLRAPGEVYLQGSSPPSADTTAWVERIDAESLDPLARSPDLPGGPWWPGGILTHANGDLYVTHGNWCHRLDPQLRLVASRQLPHPRAYNSLLALSDGNLVMKSQVRDGSAQSYFSVLEPERLDFVEREVAIPEGSIARISRDIADGNEYVYVAGDHTIFRYAYRAGALRRDETWQYRYRTAPSEEQSYAWDPVIAAGAAWFMDNGEGEFRGSLRGGGKASGPLHLFRVPLNDAPSAISLTPFALSHGTIVNPPAVDAARRVVVAYDSGNARIAAFRFGASADFEPLWERPMGASNHFLLYPASGEIVVNDFDGAHEHVVVLDIESGAERARVATPSTVASVVFQSPGWRRDDVYTCTFTTLTRTYIE